MTESDRNPTQTNAERPTYSVVVPVYNSVDSLPELVERLERVFRDTLGESYEIVMIDDGSTNPETWPTLEHLAAEHPQLGAIQLMRNFGKHGALICGLQEVKGRWIVTMDDDLQHRPEDLPRLAAQRDHDLVIGAFQRKHHSLFKRVTSRIKGWFDYKLAKKPRHILTSPFMLIRSEVARAAIDIRTPYPIVAALLFHVTRDSVNVPVSHDPRMYGRSEFTLRKMLGVFSNLLLHNSSFLLNLVVAAGALVSLLSFLLGGYVIVQAFHRDYRCAGVGVDHGGVVLSRRVDTAHSRRDRRIPAADSQWDGSSASFHRPALFAEKHAWWTNGALTMTRSMNSDDQSMHARKHFVIGATQRCESTYLYYLLTGHPEIEWRLQFDQNRKFFLNDAAIQQEARYGRL